MNTIAIIDDRLDDRETAQRRIERGLKDLGETGTWRVLSSEPLSNLEHYPSWLTSEDVKVLILDQRLNESGENRVTYSGHDIVSRVAPRMFDLPVYYLTAIGDVSELQDDRRLVHGILQRNEFVDSDPKPYVREFIREGIRYSEKIERRLARLSELAETAVSGTLTDEEATEAASIRQELQLVFEDGSANSEAERANRAGLLNELDQELALFELALGELRQILNSIPDNPAEDAN